ncbi:MAG TPA: SH3 domain-containing protein [Novosphingobium sp.]|nr:SH3 domain-containing protein [Novosphingobium sp.]
MRTAHLTIGAALAAAMMPAPSARAQDREVPYWATLTADKVNMRVGPARDYGVAWVYRRDGLPLKVVRLHEGWRLVQDPDGARGWILSRFLSRARGAIVQRQVAEIRDKPAGRVLWRAAPGVVGRLGDCERKWCRFDTDGHKGWIAADTIWGEGEP